jgi:hypothetical protein
MESLLKSLNEADESLIKLFFVKKIVSKKNNDVRYEFTKTCITPDIGNDLRLNACDQISKKMGRDIVNYDILPSHETTVVETLPFKEVPHLSDFTASLADQNLPIITDKDISKVNGYILRIENEDNTIYLFKHNTPKELLEKGKMQFIFNKDEGRFSSLDETIFALEKIYDAALLLPNFKRAGAPSPKERENYENTPVYIFEHSSFEVLFGFKEYFLERIQSNQKYLDDVGLVDSAETLIKCCGEDGRLIKKLARILQAKQLDSMNVEKLKEVAKDYCPKVKFLKGLKDKNEKITVENDTIREILHLLDDDYAKSEIRNKKCLMISKSEIE